MGFGLQGSSLGGGPTVASGTIAPAGTSALLAGPLGASASDVVTKIGSTVADGSVNAAAKLLSVRTGLNGGTEVEKAFIDASGNIVGGSGSTNSGQRLLSVGRSVSFAEFSQGSASTTPSWIVRSSSGKAMAMLAGTSGVAISYDNTVSLLFIPDSRANLDAGTPGTGTVVSSIDPLGRFDQLGTDSTGTPGAATINKPTGKSAIAAAAASVVITCSECTASSIVLITPHARDATCKELIAVPAAGSFTVSGSAAATATLPFSWKVQTIL